MQASQPAKRFLWAGVSVLVLSAWLRSRDAPSFCFYPGHSEVAALCGRADEVSLYASRDCSCTSCRARYFWCSELFSSSPAFDKKSAVSPLVGPPARDFGLVIGISALVMSYTMNIGGPNETAATTLYAIVFLVCLIKAYRFIRRKQVARHREWIIRAYAVGLGVATTRPIVGAFFAFLPAYTYTSFSASRIWLGFTTTLLAGEAWIDYTRHRQPVVSR